MTLELYINNELRGAWPIDDFQPGFGELMHVSRAQYVQSVIDDLKKNLRIYTMLYDCEHWEFYLCVKSRAKVPERDTDLLTEKI
jgi:hypothetical protein